MTKHKNAGMSDEENHMVQWSEAETSNREELTSLFYPKIQPIFPYVHHSSFMTHNNASTFYTSCLNDVLNRRNFLNKTKRLLSQKSVRKKKSAHFYGHFFRSVSK